MHATKYRDPGMIFLVILSSLVCSAKSQYQSVSTDQEDSVPAPYSAAPLHYVKIGPRLAGDYQFGYDTGKGPMGQSFREEVRLADGTIKGSYGVIDELGHKRVVHYSAGKGGLSSEQDTNKLNPSLLVRQRQPKFLMEQNFNTLSQQFPIFKPVNYLQSRAVSPLYVPVHPEQTDNRLPVVEEGKKPAEPIYRLPNWTQRDRLYRTSAPVPSQKASVTAVRTPLQTVILAAPLYKTAAVPTPTQKVFTTAVPTLAQKVSATTVQAPPVNLAVPLYRTSAPAQEASAVQSPLQPVKVVPLFRKSTVPKPSQKVSSTSVRSSEVRQDVEDKNIATLTEIYNSQTRRRVTKKPSPSTKPQRIQNTKKQIVEQQAYDAKLEDDYYDSAPAFIDIERLSYNIGSDKSSASV